MTINQVTIASGTLGENGDTFFIMTPQKMILVDAPFAIDNRLLGQVVSAAGRMGIPRSAPGITKLIVNKIISHSAIAAQAFDIYKSGTGGSQDDNWFHSERELLNIL